MIQSFCYIFGRSDRLRFLCLLLMMIGGSLLELCTLGAVPLFISALLNGPAAWMTRYCTAERLPVAGSLLLLGLFILRTTYFMLMYAFQERILNNRQIALSSRLFHAYMSAPFSVFRLYNSSTLINNISNDAERLIRNVLDPAISLVRNAFVVLTVLGLLLAFDSAVSILSFGVLALFGGLFMTLSRKRLHKYGVLVHDSRERIVKNISESAGLFKEASLLHCKDFYSARNHVSLQQMAKSNAALNLTQKCLWPSMELLTVLVLLGTLVVLLLTRRTPAAIAPTLALLTVSLARLKGCVTEIMLFHSHIRYNANVLDNIAGELRRLESQQQAESSQEKLPFQHELAVENVSFSYPGAEQPVIKGRSFAIPKGTSIGFIGKTGSGKTTMADLLLGLFTPDSGKITLDGQNIADNLAGYQRLLGYVPQDIFLLDDSIRANVALGVDDADIDEDALAQALATAQLSDFIATLPQGDRSIIGERGTLLSGGQRQRIGIARALYRKPEIIVLDEATSALDNETEAAVVKALDALQLQHTLIIVAHRLSTIQNCQQIIDFSA